MSSDEVNIKPKHEIGVSIIVPVYNAENTLARCVRSILDQAFADLEVICVDDSSTDESPDILRRLAQEDDRVTVITNPINSGCLISRKNGVMAARGKYIMFADNDDYYLPDSISEIYGEITEADVDILLYGAVGKREEGLPSDSIPDKRIRSYNNSLKVAEEEYRGENCLMTVNAPDRLWNKIVRAEVCKRAYAHTENIRLTHAEDTYACWLIHYFASSFKAITKIYYVHSMGKGLTTRVITRENYREWVRCRKDITIALKRFLKSIGADDILMDLYRRKEQTWFNYCMNVLRRVPDGEDADGYIDILSEYYGEERVKGELLRKKFFLKAGDSVKSKDGYRILLYIFYDIHGIVDDYVIYQLKEMKKACDRIIVISQCDPENSELAKFYPITREVIIRKNEGYDAGAWRECIIDVIGIEGLSRYDEVLLMNDSCYGPIYPIEELFEKMDRSDADFWGITRNYESRDAYGISPYGYFPTHLQSYFICFRRRAFMSDAFKRFWEEMPSTDDFKRAVSLFEVVITKTLEDSGLVSDVYCDTSAYHYGERKNLNPTLFLMDELLIQARNPFIKKKHINGCFDKITKKTDGSIHKRCIDYIDRCTDYDIDLIRRNAIRTGKVRQLYSAGQMNYFLPDDVPMPGSGRKIAVIMHLYYPELFDFCHDYAFNIPSYADLYITCSNPDKLETIVGRFADVKTHKTEYRLVNNRGQDISALLIGARDIFNMDYDYIAFVHDKMSFYGTIDQRAGEGFRDLLFDCILKSEGYIENVIQLLEKNPHIGLLTPAFPMSGCYADNYGKIWLKNYSGATELSKRLGLRCNLDSTEDPIALGTAFWCRPRALKKLLDYPWRLEDFPCGKDRREGDILHVVERIFEYVAQDAGFYTGVIVPSSRASLLYGFEHEMLKELKRTLGVKNKEIKKHKEEIERLKKDGALQDGED